MRTVHQRLISSPAASERLVLPFALRRRAGGRAQLESGTEVTLSLEREIALRGGDRLLAEDGTIIEVVAAVETVSMVRESDPRRLARVAYYLGTRRVPVEIGAGWLRYPQDQALDDRVRELGLAVDIEQAPFEPEAPPEASPAPSAKPASAQPAGSFEAEHSIEFTPDMTGEHTFEFAPQELPSVGSGHEHDGVPSS